LAWFYLLHSGRYSQYSAVGYVIFVVKYFTSGYQHASVHTVKGLHVHQENAETQVF